MYAAATVGCYRLHHRCCHTSRPRLYQHGQHLSLSLRPLSSLTILRLFALNSKVSTLHSRPCASTSPRNLGAHDPELRAVLELATNAELYELESILYGPSYFSPVLKSVTMNRAEFDHFMIEEDIEERDQFIGALESQFLFLAADARSTLRGWRPTYRNVLLSVRKELNIPCSRRLCTEDLEAEILVYLLEKSSSQSLDQATTAALKVGVAELQSTLAKLARRMVGKAVLDTAKHQVEKNLFRKGGQLAAVNLERQASLLAARKGLTKVASGYLGIRSLVAFLGPVMWGTFLADVVIQMLGTDYARVLRAIVSVAQIRLSRTYRLEQQQQPGQTDAML